MPERSHPTAGRTFLTRKMWTGSPYKLPERAACECQQESNSPSAKHSEGVLAETILTAIGIDWTFPRGSYRWSDSPAFLACSSKCAGYADAAEWPAEPDFPHHSAVFRETPIDSPVRLRIRRRVRWAYHSGVSKFTAADSSADRHLE